MILLFLLLWFVYLASPYVPEEPGIEVALVENMEELQMGSPAREGGGEPEPTPAPAPTPAASPTPAPKPTPAVSKPSNPAMTQEDPNSLAIKQQQERERKQAAELAAAEAKRLKEEAAREAAAKAAAEKAAAEKAAAEQAKRDKASSAMAGLFGGNSGGTNGGEGTGTNKAGNPAGSGKGSGTSGAGSWSLTGRDLNGALAQPAYGSNAEGVVVVKIRVNAAGVVTEASLGQGSTTSDQTLIQAAIAAAKKAKFSTGNGDVVGTIKYVFKLN